MARNDDMRSGPIPLVLNGLCCLWLSLSASPAPAVDLGDDRVHLDLYGTAGGAFLSSDDRELFHSTGRTGGSLTGNPGLDFDSRLGLQVEGMPADNLSLVWQGLLQGDSGRDNAVDTKWAYVGYRPVAWLDLKLGRFMTPFYQISDQMYVGYAHPWVRPPLEVYGLVGRVDRSDGLWMRLHLPTERFTSSLDLSVSWFSDRQDDVKYEISPLVTSVLNLSRGGLSLRAMVANAPIRLSGGTVDRLQALLDTPDASHRYDVTGEDARYYNLAFKYQDPGWYVSGEYVRTDLDGNHAFSETEAYTFTLGHYWHDLLPYLVLSELDVLNTEPETGLSGEALAIAREIIDGRKNDQRTFGLGLRWDFYPGLALKAQVDWVRTGGGQRGLFDAPPGETVNVYSLVLDWAL